MKSHKGTLSLILSGFFFLLISSFTKIYGQISDSLTFDSLVIEEHIPLLADSISPTNTLSIHFVFPTQVCGDLGLLESIQKEFVKALFGPEYAELTPNHAIDIFYQKYKQDYLATAADYNKAKADGLDMKSWGDTFQTMRADTVSLHRGILSFSISIEKRMGGVHDSRHMNYYNINLNTGKLISESDIFKPGYEAKLTEAIIAQLLEDNNLTKPKQLIEKGYFNLYSLKPNKNFLIGKDSIVYAFNESEIAPYSMGMKKVSLPEDKVASILKDEK